MDDLGRILAIAAPALIVLAGIWRGGLLRRASIGVLVAWVASALVTGQPEGTVNLLVFGIDVLLAAYLTWLTLARRPLWLILAAACAVMLVANHIAFAVNFNIGDWAFLSVTYLWSAGVLLGLLLGQFERRRAD